MTESLPKEEERILCAAIWYKDVELKRDIPQVRPKNVDRGIVVLGYRHGQCIWTMACLTGLRTVDNGEDAAGDHEQGFLTSTNRFVERTEALAIAKSSNQLLAGEHVYNELYSENLY